MLNKNKQEGKMPAASAASSFRGKWLSISLALMIFSLASLNYFLSVPGGFRHSLALLMVLYGVASGCAWYAGKGL